MGWWRTGCGCLVLLFPPEQQVSCAKRTSRAGSNVSRAIPISHTTMFCVTSRTARYTIYMPQEAPCENYHTSYTSSIKTAARVDLILSRKQQNRDKLILIIGQHTQKFAQHSWPGNKENYMPQQFNNHIDDLPQKLLFLAVWPGERHIPEIWTLSDIERDFGSSGEIMYYINKMQIGESLHETESNLILIRVPSYSSTQELSRQLGLPIKA